MAAGKLLQLKRPPVKPDGDVVALCRFLLKQAEAGEIRALAVAVDLTEDNTSNAIAYANGTRTVALLGAIELVKLKAIELCKQNTR